MKCKYLKIDGNKCKAQAIKGSEYCFFHNPATRKKHLEASKKGGTRIHYIEVPHYEVYDLHVIDSSTGLCKFCKKDSFTYRCMSNYEFRDKGYEELKAYMDKNPGLYLIYPDFNPLFNQDLSIVSLYQIGELPDFKIKFYTEQWGKQDE